MSDQPDWRTRKKTETRLAIQRHALALFVEKGYDNTTVDEIAAAAGVSHMTFFRYFPRKESVVEYDDYDPMLADLIVNRPAGEAPLEALHAAVRTGLQQILPADRQALLVRTRLMLKTPALRSRTSMAQDDTIDLLARALARRTGDSAPALATRVLAAAALGAMQVALTAWAAADDADLVGLVDEAFAALRADGHPAR